MTVPVVSSLARQYPDLRITVLSSPFARTFFEGLAPNVGFMAADFKNEYLGLKGLNTLYKRLAAKHFTDVADFHDVLRSKYLRMRFALDHYHVAHIDKHRKGKRQLSAPEGKKVMKRQPTSFQNYADVLAELGLPVKIEFEKLQSIAGETIDYSPRKGIGIAPFAAHMGKVYPVREMEKVIQQINAYMPDEQIYLFGGKSEMVLINEWCNDYKNCINASARMGSLSNEIKLMATLRCMVSMDSANMHLASLVGTPVVSVWGATHPYAGFLGWNQSEDNAVQLPLPCRPCSVYGNKPCLRGDYACMSMITPEMIVEKIAKIS